MSLLAQVVVGYAGWFTPRREIFPFTAWFMFALVPNEQTDYDVLLHGPAIHPQEPPQNFDQSGVFVHAPHSIVSHQLIQQLGDAVEKGDAARIAYLRPQLEEQFAAAHMRYDLIKVTYTPVVRWKTGRVLSSRVLRSFVATEPPQLDPDRPPPLEQEPDVTIPDVRPLTQS